MQMLWMGPLLQQPCICTTDATSDGWFLQQTARSADVETRQGSIRSVEEAVEIDAVGAFEGEDHGLATDLEDVQARNGLGLDVEHVVAAAEERCPVAVRHDIELDGAVSVDPGAALIEHNDGRVRAEGVEQVVRVRADLVRWSPSKTVDTELASVR